MPGLVEDERAFAQPNELEEYCRVQREAGEDSAAYHVEVRTL
jgi:hypothetical protein